MRMARMIVARFDCLSKADWPGTEHTFGTIPVSVFGLKHDDDATQALLIAEVSIPDRPDANSKGELLPHPGLRRRLEEQLELAVDGISVATRAPRSIRSPDPCLGFLADDDSDAAWLDLHRGIVHVNGAYPAVRPQVPLRIVHELSADRPDGIALLAEALANPHPSGRFHELFRLFERAFRLSCGKVGGPLKAFLAGTACGYTKHEVDEWARKRGPTTHADRRDEFLRERDTASLVHRMEQAAFDVLVNKSEWRSSSSARTDRWKPDFGTTDSQTGVFITQGRAATLGIHPLDQFGVYPLDLKLRLGTPPPGWWVKRPSSPPGSEA